VPSAGCIMALAPTDFSEFWLLDTSGCGKSVPKHCLQPVCDKRRLLAKLLALVHKHNRFSSHPTLLESESSRAVRLAVVDLLRIQKHCLRYVLPQADVTSSRQVADGDQQACSRLTDLRQRSTQLDASVKLPMLLAHQSGGRAPTSIHIYC
jgi:hypothetical protein